jgi:hypothetical protein
VLLGELPHKLCLASRRCPLPRLLGLARFFDFALPLLLCLPPGFLFPLPFHLAQLLRTRGAFVVGRADVTVLTIERMADVAGRVDATYDDDVV